MTEEKKVTKETEAPGDLLIDRIFEQPPDAISFYCEMGQVLATKNEVVMQFYEMIPGTPEKDGQITRVRNRLRATITVSPAHAKNIAKSILERTGADKK